jgi:hypothetical protein
VRTRLLCAYMDRSERIHLRVSQQERERIEKRAESRGQTVSAFLRTAALDGVTFTPNTPEPPKAQPPAPTDQLLYCPITGCAFAARSPQAKCPDHGRKVVIPSSDLNPSRTSHGASDDG